MPELVLTEVNASVLNQLQERAHKHGRTPEEEAKAILSAALRKPADPAWESVDAIYYRLLGAGQTHGDSVESLREDRER